MFFWPLLKVGSRNDGMQSVFRACLRRKILLRRILKSIENSQLNPHSFDPHCAPVSVTQGPTDTLDERRLLLRVKNTKSRST